MPRPSGPRPDTGTDAATRLRRPRPAPWTLAAAGAWVALLLGLGVTRPYLYEGLLQEDRFVEWWTATLFASAGVLALRLALQRRRIGDGLVGAFCVFVAGEEFSWGQRLLGITPPDAFLEHNRQQELTIHNFADLFGEPKWVLVMALAGFGLVIPAIALTRPGRRLLERLGATAVRAPLALSLLGAAALLWWYPLTLTGEWVEALAGWLFVLAYAPGAGRAGMTALGGAALAGVLTVASGVGRATEAELTCARSETQAIAEDLAVGGAATARLARARTVHKRVFTAIDEGYVSREGLERYRAMACAGDGEPRYEQYAVDPWGTAYWLFMERTEAAIRIAVYSFGPNRRRDGPPGTAPGDDTTAVIEIAL